MGPASSAPRSVIVPPPREHQWAYNRLTIKVTTVSNYPPAPRSRIPPAVSGVCFTFFQF